MKKFRALLLAAALLVLSSCATGPKLSGHLSAQEVEEFMQREELARIFAGHDRIVVTMDNGDMYTANLPEMEELAAYATHREKMGKPVDYRIE
jgi:hypothetical protein